MNIAEAEDLRREILDRYPDALVDVIPDPDGVRLIIDAEDVPGSRHKTLCLSIGSRRSMLLAVLLG